MAFQMPKRHSSRPSRQVPGQTRRPEKPAGPQSAIREASGIKTLDRVVEIVNSFTLEAPSWTLAELSGYLGIPKPSLHRLLVALERCGIVIHGTEDGLWRLGYRLFVWGNLVPRITGLQHIARPIVRWLSEATEETAILTVYDRKAVVCIDKVESSHAVRLTLDIGSRRPAHAGASSKILAAFLPQAELGVILREEGLPRLNINTITDPTRLAQELETIRTNGFALSYEETDAGAWGVAVPIMDGHAQVVAAIGVAGPIMRHSNDIAMRYVDLCRRAATDIAQILSGRTLAG